MHSKLSCHKSFSESPQKENEASSLELQTSSSASIKNFMKTNHLRLSMSKKPSFIQSPQAKPPPDLSDLGLNSSHLPPEFLSSYSFLRKIDKGMQGRVFQIQEISTGILYAAKVYETHDEEIIAQIRNEALILSTLNHPNIIKFCSFYSQEEEGIYIIITEYFPSVNLESIVESGVLSAEEKEALAKVLIGVMVYLQENKITHGDFNLSNILVDPSNLTVRLIDFGVSRITDKSGTGDFQSPKGFLIYRPPIHLEMFYHRDRYDLWGLLLVLMSVYAGRNVCSKGLMRILEEEACDHRVCQYLCEALREKRGKEPACLLKEVMRLLC